MSFWDNWGDAIVEIGGNLLGGYFEGKSGDKNRKVSMEDAERLIQLLDLHNNPNTFGVFGGWQNQIGPDGRLTQTQLVNPQMQGGIDKFIGRFNEGGVDPQMQGLKNALYDRTLNRSGPNPMPQRRQRPKTRAECTDDEGNYIRPPDWWHRGAY